MYISHSDTIRYMEYQIHSGRKFYQDKKTGYWISTDHPRTRAHRWVWENHHGKIPNGYHVHHRDENKSNNEISNLTLLTQSDHCRHHYTEEKRQASSNLMDKIRPLTKEWHGSEEGKKWHQAHGILSWKDRKEIEIICKICQKLSKTKTYHQQFCSNSCKSKWRRSQRLDDIEKICPICEKRFRINKYKKTLTCNRICAQKLNKKTLLP